MQLYLDSNAHVSVTKKALSTFVDFNDSLGGHGHPSSPSLLGREAASALEKSREKIAKLIGATSASQIFFTTSCTQACSWVANMVHPSEGSQTAVSKLEHPAMKQAFMQNPFQYVFDLPSDKNGVVYPPFHLNDFETYSDPEVFTQLKWDGFCKPEMILVCIHVQNEIGTIQPIEKMTKSMVISDMSQSLGKVPVNVTDMDVEMAVFGSHKFGGPSGVGFIYLKNTERWNQFGTGSRYYMDIPGTPNVGAVVATAVALEEALGSLDYRTENMISFREYLEPHLEELGFEIVGKEAARCPNTTFTKAPQNALKLMMELGKVGIHCGLGSACGALHNENTPILKALGRSGSGHEYMRISQFGEYGLKEAQIVIDNINKLI